MADHKGSWTALAPKPSPLGEGQRYHVFLSYRSVDRPWVLNLYDVLQSHGFKVFVDQVALTPGDSLNRELELAMKQSRAGVLVWSSASSDSEWLRNEYDSMVNMVAEKSGFRFVPLKIDASELPLFARSRMYLDFSSYPDGPNGGELLQLLHAVEDQALSPTAARFATDQTELAKQSNAQVAAAIKNDNVPRLMELFKAGGEPWKTSSALGCRAAEGLIKLKAYGEAIELLKAQEEDFPRAIRPRQLRALALARRGGEGDLEEAQTILGELAESGERDPETLGIYGRTWMDRHARTGDKADLEQSRDLYAEAFESFSDDYYTGINAAAKSVLLGDLDEANRFAAAVENVVGSEPIRGDYWKTATAAEVQLLQGRFDRAAELYSAAIASARKETGSHESTWLQVCRLLEHLDPSDADRAALRTAFSHLPDCDEMLSATQS